MRMERIYSDASFCAYNGIGGMAVVVPENCASFPGAIFTRAETAGRARAAASSNGTLSPANSVSYRVRIVKDPAAENSVILCAACPCSDPQEAETRAMSIAFIAGWNMLRSGICDKVEIVSDCLNVIDMVTSGDTQGDLLLGSMHNLWMDRRMIINKVKAHNGNWGNELADAWAKYAARSVGSIPWIRPAVHQSGFPDRRPVYNSRSISY